MGKSTKDKRDIYYRQGKAEGYRARSAYKLLHLNEQYGFLGGAESFALEPQLSGSESSKQMPTPSRVVDLCAAPGSWSQVLSQRLAKVPGSHLVAVDLQAMAPLPGVKQIIGDITTAATAAAVAKALADGPSDPQTSQTSKGKAKAQLIVCDGAPDVTGLHDLDEYLQSQLMLAATQITFRLLQEGGTFVAKIFTQNPQAGLAATLDTTDLSGAIPATSGALLAQQLRTFFDVVDIAKPRSSRLGSVEHFLVCLGFKPPRDLPTSIIGFSRSGDVDENTDDDLAREGLVQYAERLKAQFQRPSQTNNTTDHERELLKIIPFASCGDLSGYDA